MAITSPALTTSPSLISTFDRRPVTLAPTLDHACGTTYPVAVTMTDDCAGDTIATSVIATDCL